MTKYLSKEMEFPVFQKMVVEMKPISEFINNLVSCYCYFSL